MSAWGTALRMLARRRLTEAQLREKLARKEIASDDIAAVVERAKAVGFLDDKLFASLYLDAKQTYVGDRRLIADLVRRGIDRETAASALAASDATEEERLVAAYEKLQRTRSNLSLPLAARALERKGFPASAIYRLLRSLPQES